MRNADRVIFVANTRFHGVLGFGYGTLMPSNLYTPFIALSVTKEFQRIKLYMNSYIAITAIARTTNCKIDLTDFETFFNLSPASLVTQNHDNTDTIIRYVMSFANP